MAWRQHQIRRVAVLDEPGKLVGIVSLNDLTPAARRQREREAAEVSGAEIAVKESLDRIIERMQLA